jgi:hypothetical protein
MAVTDTEKTKTGVRWQLAGTMVQACNCDWGCPCEFNAPPSHGYCHGTWTWHVQEGSFGITPLDGIHFAAACKWPGAIHLGQGECLPILDRTASEAQLAAVGTLLGGTAGGPWAVIASTLVKIHEPQIVDWEFDNRGPHSRLQAGNLFELQLTPLTNPVSGETFEAIVTLPTGFVAKQLSHASSVAFKVAGPIDYAYPGQDAAYGRFEYEGWAPAGQ